MVIVLTMFLNRLAPYLQICQLLQHLPHILLGLTRFVSLFIYLSWLCFGRILVIYTSSPSLLPYIKSYFLPYGLHWSFFPAVMSVFVPFISDFFFLMFALLHLPFRRAFEFQMWPISQAVMRILIRRLLLQRPKLLTVLVLACLGREFQASSFQEHGVQQCHYYNVLVQTLNESDFLSNLIISNIHVDQWTLLRGTYPQDKVLPNKVWLKKTGQWFL